MQTIHQTLIEILAHGTRNAREIRKELDRRHISGPGAVFAMNDLLRAGRVRRLVESDKFTIVNQPLIK